MKGLAASDDDIALTKVGLVSNFVFGLLSGTKLLGRVKASGKLCGIGGPAVPMFFYLFD